MVPDRSGAAREHIFWHHGADPAQRMVGDEKSNIFRGDDFHRVDLH